MTCYMFWCRLDFFGRFGAENTVFYYIGCCILDFMLFEPKLLFLFFLSVSLRVSEAKKDLINPTNPIFSGGGGG